MISKFFCFLSATLFLFSFALASTSEIGIDFNIVKDFGVVENVVNPTLGLWNFYLPVIILILSVIILLILLKKKKSVFSKKVVISRRAVVRKRVIKRKK